MAKRLRLRRLVSKLNEMLFVRRHVDRLLSNTTWCYQCQLFLSGGPQSEQVGLAKYLLNSKLESKQAQQATYDTKIKANSNSSDLQFKQTLKDKTANYYKDLIKLVKHYTLFSINLLAFYHECCSLIGYATHYLFNNQTTSPSFLRADSQRGAAELTIARRKRGRVV